MTTVVDQLRIQIEEKRAKLNRLKETNAATTPFLPTPNDAVTLHHLTSTLHHLQEPLERTLRLHLRVMRLGSFVSALLQDQNSKTNKNTSNEQVDIVHAEEVHRMQQRRQVLLQEVQELAAQEEIRSKQLRHVVFRDPSSCAAASSISSFQKKREVQTSSNKTKNEKKSFQVSRGRNDIRAAPTTRSEEEDLQLLLQFNAQSADELTSVTTTWKEMLLKQTSLKKIRSTAKMTQKETMIQLQHVLQERENSARKEMANMDRVERENRTLAQLCQHEMTSLRQEIAPEENYLILNSSASKITTSQKQITA